MIQTILFFITTIWKNLKTKEGMPDWFIPLVNRITKEGKIKDKNFEPMKPINPNK